MLLLVLLPNISSASGRCVVMIHGLARTHTSMAKLARALKLHNYQVVNKNYPSSRKTIVDIANEDIPLMVDACLTAHPDNIYFVTHSMGGVILRKYLQTHSLPSSTRIVMLAPPNHGSPWANSFHNNVLFKMITGPAGQELTSEKTSLLNRLNNSLPYQVGIIAGNFSFLPVMKWFFHEDNDGKVTVSSTKLVKMKDFIVLPVSHTFMMNNALVEKQVLHFFEYGEFIH